MNHTPRSLFDNLCRLARPTALAFILGACGAQSPMVSDSLDPQTGVTVTRASSPLVLFHDNSRAAAHARHYLYLAPLQINRMGELRYYLWLAAWSTIVDTDAAEIRDALESVVVFADSEPLSLELVGWTPVSAGLSRPVYATPVASAIEAYYAVTLDQIRLIAQSQDIRVRGGSTLADDFSPWETRSSARDGLRAFVASVSF